MASAGFLLNLSINSYDRLLLSSTCNMDESSSSRLDYFFLERGSELRCLFK